MSTGAAAVGNYGVEKFLV